MIRNHFLQDAINYKTTSLINLRTWSQNNERFILRDLHHLCFPHKSFNSVKFANNQFNARRSYIPWIFMRTIDYENCPDRERYTLAAVFLSAWGHFSLFVFLEGLCMCRWTNELKVYSRISEIILKKKKKRKSLKECLVSSSFVLRCYSVCCVVDLDAREYT